MHQLCRDAVRGSLDTSAGRVQQDVRLAQVISHVTVQAPSWCPADARGCRAPLSCDPACERGDINLVSTGSANSHDLADALAAVQAADRPWIRDRIVRSVQDMVLETTGYALHFTGDTLVALDEALGIRFSGLVPEVPYVYVPCGGRLPARGVLPGDHRDTLRHLWCPGPDSGHRASPSTTLSNLNIVELSSRSVGDAAADVLLQSSEWLRFRDAIREKETTEPSPTAPDLPPTAQRLTPKKN